MQEEETSVFEIDSRLKVFHCLGQGSHGKVFKAYNTQTKSYTAIKMIRKDSKELVTLQREVCVLQELKKTPGFPTIISFGTFKEFAYIEIELLEYNLEQMKRDNGGSIKLQTLHTLATSILDRIRKLHSLGIIHRDIKPENFMIKDDCLYMIDFGLSKNCVKNGKHIDYCENKGLVGTIRYSSANTQLGIEQTRRDDLESIGYLLIYLYRGSLPWQNLPIKDKDERMKKILDVKKSIPLEKLCLGCPSEFVDYFKYVKSLSFTQQPDYNYLMKLFSKAEVMTSDVSINSKEVMIGAGKVFIDGFNEIADEKLMEYSVNLSPKPRLIIDTQSKIISSSDVIWEEGTMKPIRALELTGITKKRRHNIVY